MQTQSCRCHVLFLVCSFLPASGPPVIPENLTSVISTEGQTVLFRCMAGSDPLPNISWLFNDTLISSTAQRSIRSETVELSRTSELTLADITNQDFTGSYTCLASNVHPPSATTSAFLTVYSKKDTISKLSNVSTVHTSEENATSARDCASGWPTAPKRCCCILFWLLVQIFKCTARRAAAQFTLVCFAICMNVALPYSFAYY